MTESLYSIEFAQRAPPGSRAPFVRQRVWNARGEDALVPETLARKTAMQMAEATKCGARVMDGDRELVRYLYREGTVIEIAKEMNA